MQERQKEDGHLGMTQRPMMGLKIQMLGLNGSSACPSWWLGNQDGSWRVWRGFVLSIEKLATVFILVQQSGQMSLKEKEASRRKRLAVPRPPCITKHSGRGPYPGIVGFLFHL